MKYLSANKTLFVLCNFLLCSTFALGQDYQIGHHSTNFTDTDRDREISVEIYYPANSSGEDVSIANGTFPVLVFGHGFLIDWESYENYWTHLVPDGYVICFPTTEMGLSPSHDSFGKDLAFVASQMQVENNINNSLFFGALSEKTALMGHSMGGGASFLAAANNTNIHSLINFAAAETDPSAIAAAATISVPTLIFSADEDCVTPPADHQNLMYNALTTDCKVQIEISGGGHCYFANNNGSCNLGEAFCNPDLTISRETQQEITNEYLLQWLNYQLKDDQTALNSFTNTLQTSSGSTYNYDCNALSVPVFSEDFLINVTPNPSSAILQIQLPIEKTGGRLNLYNYQGQIVYQTELKHTENTISLSGVAKGSYILQYDKDTWSHRQKFIKN